MSDLIPGLSGIASWVTDVVESLGYVGLFLMIALENVFPPIPSEIVLPLAGFLTGQGRMNFVGAVLAATLGSLAGALILYYAGYVFGESRVRALVHRWGKWAMVSVDDIDKASAWFDHHDREAVLIGRLFPVVRSLISIPAGIRRMAMGRFLLYTAVGSAVWNTTLIGIGWILGDNWESVEEYVGYLQYLVILAVLVAVAWFVATRLRQRARNRAMITDSRPRP
jgi:membrane protein DedA with SNARE-associated domain